LVKLYYSIETVPRQGYRASSILGAGKLRKLGKLPLNCSIQAFYLLDKPANGPDWTLRLQVQALLPKFMGEKSGSGE